MITRLRTRLATRRARINAERDLMGTVHAAYELETRTDTPLYVRRRTGEPLFDQTVYETKTVPRRGMVDVEALTTEFDLLALPIAVGVLNGPREAVA